MANKQGTQAIAQAQTRAVAKYELPKPIAPSTPVHNCKAESLLNSVIVLRGVGPRIDAQLGPCRAIYFQFPTDFEDNGPIKGGATKDTNGEWAANFPDDADDGVWQFLVSESSPACRKAKESMGPFMESRGTSASLAVLRQQASKMNPGQAYYVLDAPKEGDIFADRADVEAQSLG